MEKELELNPNWSRRRQNRAAAFRFLFQWELNRPEDLGSELDEFLARIGETRESFAYATELVDGVTTNLETLDERIGALAKNWKFSRIAKTDLALLRLAAFEILYRLDVPPAVVIDEALELAKTFSTENSRKFLNGILDKLLQDQGRPAREASVE
ncbi:MAG: transcription antitermination factor NusB [Opitutales bacterium]